jgi:hypothetical protein
MRGDCFYAVGAGPRLLRRPSHNRTDKRHHCFVMRMHSRMRLRNRLWASRGARDGRLSPAWTRKPMPDDIALQGLRTHRRVSDSGGDLVSTDAGRAVLQETPAMKSARVSRTSASKFRRFRNRDRRLKPGQRRNRRKPRIPSLRARTLRKGPEIRGSFWETRRSADWLECVADAAVAANLSHGAETGNLQGKAPFLSLLEPFAAV